MRQFLSYVWKELPAFVAGLVVGWITLYLVLIMLRNA